MSPYELHTRRKRYAFRQAIAQHMLGWHYLGLASGLLAALSAISATVLAVLWGCS